MFVKKANGLNVKVNTRKDTKRIANVLHFKLSNLSYSIPLFVK